MMQGSSFSPRRFRVSRVFSAPRETVFKAWSSADHVKRWFCPDGYSVPEATVEMRVGGRVRGLHALARRRGPLDQGDVHRGRRPERLAIDHHVIDPCGGGPLFSAVTEVAFIDKGRGRHADGGGPDLYARRPGAGGANDQGRARGLAPDTRQARGGSAAHAGERRRPVRRPRRLPSGAHLRGDGRSKCTRRCRTRRPRAAGFMGLKGGGWSSAPWTSGSAGRERVKGGFEGGVTTTFDAIYHDIVPRERIVYTYEMHLDERKISVSLATLQIKPAGAGTDEAPRRRAGRVPRRLRRRRLARARDGGPARQARRVAPGVNAPHSSFEALRSSQPRYSDSRPLRSRTPSAAAIPWDERDAAGLERRLHLIDRFLAGTWSGAPVSNRSTVENGTPAASASLVCDQPIRARPALTWAASIIHASDVNCAARTRDSGDGGGAAPTRECCRRAPCARAPLRRRWWRDRATAARIRRRAAVRWRGRCKSSGRAPREPPS